MSRVLVIGLAPLPFEDVRKNSAPGLRTWQFALSLAQDAHEVLLVCYRIPFVYEGKSSGAESQSPLPNMKILWLDNEQYADNALLQKIHDDFCPDCVVGVNVYGSCRACSLETEKPVWADINGYYMAEAQAKAYTYGDNKYLGRFWKNELAVLDRADVFSTVSDAQRHATIGELATRGRLNRETSGYEFAYTVRNGVDPAPYSHTRKVLRGVETAEDDFIVLWSGAYNVWADVHTLVKGLELAMAENPRIKFVSTGGSIAGHDERTYPEMLVLVGNSPFRKNFLMKGWVEKEDLHNYYFESDVGIIAEKYIYEGLFGCRNRLLDWYKTGLPSLANELCELTRLSKLHGAGLTFGFGDPAGLREKLLYLSGNPQKVRELGENAKKYCMENHRFARTTFPLREWVKNPLNAPDFGRHASLEPEDGIKNIVSKSALRTYFFRYLAAPLICLSMPFLLLLFPLIFTGLLSVSLLRVIAGKGKAGTAEVSALPKPGGLASILVLNWNGRKLLGKCLPSVIEAVEYSGRDHEIIVVDNGSCDGSADFVEKRFPRARVVALKKNMRYAGANNIAAARCKNDIIILLNNDMTVEKGFIAPLLEHFSDGSVFAVSSRIIMPVKYKNGVAVRETGITKGGFLKGFFEVWQEDLELREAAPVLYFSGGSSACDRKKFLELGGFDTLFNPFYYEDADLSYRARKKGWKILCEPRSVVHHEYQGTNNSRNFREAYVKLAMKKNYILFVWKNVTSVPMTLRHLKHLFLRLFASVRTKDVLFTAAYLRAVLQLGEALVKRFSANSKSALGDEEAIKWM